MRPFLSSFFSSHPFAVLCLAVLFSNNAVFTRPVSTQDLGHILLPDLSPAIHLSEIRDAKGEGTGVRFLTIGPRFFCKNQVANSNELPTAMPGSKPIGYAYFKSEDEEFSAFAEAHAYAVKRVQSERGPFDDLIYLDNVMEYLHMTSGVIDEHTMELWKESLRASGGENIVLNEHANQQLGDSDMSELSPLILLSELLDAEGKGTGGRFFTIGRTRFCKDESVTESDEPPTPALSPKAIGHVWFESEAEKNTAFAEARAYAEGVRYPKPEWDPLNYLTYLDNVMEHLHNQTPRAIDDYTMKSWKEELKELKASDGEKIILNEYTAFTHPTGIIAIQIGDNVLSLTTPPTSTDKKEWIKGVILGPVNNHARIDLDEVHKHAKSHSDYCGTKENVERFKATEEVYRKRLYSRMKEALAQWRYADGVIDILARQGSVSEEISGKWDVLCPQRMDILLRYVEKSQPNQPPESQDDGQTPSNDVDASIAEKRRKADLKRSEALKRGEIILNEHMKFNNPTGMVSIQFGDEVLSLDAFPTITAGKEWIRFESLGSVNDNVRVNFKEVREHGAKSHFEYCGTKEDVAMFAAFEKKSLSKPWSRASKTAAQWKFVIGVMADLKEQGFLSQKVFDEWVKICPKRMHRIIRQIDHSNIVHPQASGTTRKRVGTDAGQLNTKKQRHNQ
ncbi:hypothetical protein EV361DRAFT_956201 [Lentinula raphanica]|nr:hypothetical protein EV361DRAFT_956201 [Lentinula raphanica]